MTTSKIQMDQIRSTSATVTGENIRAGSQKKSSLSPAEGLQGASPDATCTCPSGDGSLRHPCPSHPAVEQAGGDERAAFELFVRKHCGMPEHIAVNWDAKFTNDAWEGWQARAVLAQPSPAPELAERGTQHRFSTTEQTCRHDFAGVWWNDNGETKTGRECRHCGFFVADVIKAQAEQAEAERPPQPERYTADVFHPERPYYMAQTSVVRASDFDEFATQYERIVGALRFERQQMDRAFTACINERDAANARLHEVATACATAEQERDAALAKVAGLELKLDQSDYAYDNDRCHMRGLAKQAAEAIQVFTGHDSSANLAHRYGEKWWEHLDELRDALLAFAKNAPVAQPEEMPGEILAAKLIETWVTKHGKPAPWSTAVEITAVATNMPNDERDRLLALDDDVDAQAQHSVPGKYDDVLLPFLKSMEHELHANAGKGDRPGWLQMDRRTALLEIYYHLAKLQKATKDNDAAGIVEYAADVANMSMMLVDVCGLLAAAPGKEEV
ncbi:hypothetical protein ACV247_003302 [Pseudomonas aeruginosa]